MSKQPKKIAPAPSIVLKPSIFDRFEDQYMWHILILLIVPFFIYIKAVGFDLIHLGDRDIFLNKDPYLFRPVQNLSFILDGMIGSGRTWIYHLSNIIYHLLTVITLYSLLRLLNIKNLAAFLLSFFFALHPLLAGAVATVPGRSDLLAGLWGTLSLLTFIKYIRTEKWLYLVLHLLVFALAVFSKETAVLLPVFFVLYIFLLTNERLNSKKTAPAGIAWIIIIAAFFYLRSKVIVPDLTGEGLSMDAFINNIPALPTLLAKLFVPAKLSTMPLFESSFITLGCILLLFFIIVAVRNYLRKQYLPLIGLLWFLLLLSAGLFFQFKDNKFFQAYSEQDMYFPLIGFIFVLAFLLNEKLQLPSRFIYASLSVVVIIAFMILASVYSDSYKDSETYFGEAAQFNNPGAYTKRGEEYLTGTPKDYPSALADFNSAVEVSGTAYAPAYYDLGRATSDYLKNHQDAAADFTQAILLDSTQIDPYIDRAGEKLSLRDLGGAISDLNKAALIDSTNARLYYTFGKVYIGARDFKTAEAALSNAIRLDNGYAEAYTDRGLVYYQLNDYPDAIKDCNKAIALNGAFFTAYYNKAMVYYAMNKMDTTVKLLDTTLALADNFYFGYFYRGMAKKQLHDMKGACSDWQESVSLGFTTAEDTIKRYCK